MSIKTDILSPNDPLFRHFFIRFKCESCGIIIENKDSADLYKAVQLPSCPECGGKLKKIKENVSTDLRKKY